MLCSRRARSGIRRRSPSGGWDGSGCPAANTMICTGCGPDTCGRRSTRRSGCSRFRGARWMTLEVRKSNATAQTLYKKYGFREIGTRKGYYSDNREDAIVMWSGNLQERDYQHRLAKLRAELEDASDS